MGDKIEYHSEFNFIDHFLFGILICNLDLQIKFINHTAESMVKKSKSLNLKDGKLLTTSIDIINFLDKNLEELKSKNLSVKKEQNLNTKARFLTTNRDGRPLYIHISKIENYNWKPHTHSSSVFKFVLSDLECDIKICLETLQELYGLTTAEARVLYHVVLGRSLIQTSQILELSEGTVRTHIKRIFSKTNTHRQNELLHLVLTNPIWFASNI